MLERQRRERLPGEQQPEAEDDGRGRRRRGQGKPAVACQRGQSFGQAACANQQEPDDPEDTGHAHAEGDHQAEPEGGSP